MHRRRSERYKPVSISIMVIGVGFFLFSLIYSGIRFRGIKTFNENLEAKTVKPFHTISDTKETDFQGEIRLRPAPELGETELPRIQEPVSEDLDEDPNGEARTVELSSTSHSLQSRASSESDTPDLSQIGEQVKTLEMEIVELLSEYKHAIDQLETLGNEPRADPDVVYKYIVARRETGDQIMHKSVMYQTLTGDRGVVLPGGWIFELGKSVGFEIRHE